MRHGWVPALLLSLSVACGESDGDPAGPPPDPMPPEVSAPVSLLVGEEANATSAGDPGEWTVTDPSVLQVTPAGSNATLRALRTGSTTVIAANELGADSTRIVVLQDDETVFEILARCPTDLEIELMFEIAEVSARGTQGPTSSCEREGLPLSLAMTRMIQYVSMMARLRFDEPLPWTDKSIVHWFDDQVDAVRLDAGLAFAGVCCDRANAGLSVRNRATDVFQLQDTTAIETVFAVDGALGLLIHEARHFARRHSCNLTNDITLEELGAHAVEYYLGVWIGQHYEGALFPPGLRPLIQAIRRISLANICTPTEAFDATLHSSRGTPTLDGVVTSGEWTSPAVELPVFTEGSVGWVGAQFMNDDDSLYVFFRSRDDRPSDMGLLLDFGEVDGGPGLGPRVIPSPALSLGTRGFVDLHLAAVQRYDPDEDAGGSTDGRMVATTGSGERGFELAFPLDNGSELDLSVAPGDLLAVNVLFDLGEDVEDLLAGFVLYLQLAS